MQESDGSSTLSYCIHISNYFSRYWKKKHMLRLWTGLIM